MASTPDYSIGFTREEVEEILAAQKAELKRTLAAWSESGSSVTKRRNDKIHTVIAACKVVGSVSASRPQLQRDLALQSLYFSLIYRGERNQNSQERCCFCHFRNLSRGLVRVESDHPQPIQLGFRQENLRRMDMVLLGYYRIGSTIRPGHLPAGHQASEEGHFPIEQTVDLDSRLPLQCYTTNHKDVRGFMSLT